MTEPNCKLLQGTLTYFLQTCLGIISLSTIYFKWRREYPKRQSKVVIFDISKQVIGMGFAHLLNIAIAIMMSKRITINDQCRWYFLNFFVDIVFGIPVNYILLKYVNKFIKRKSLHILETGSYRHSTYCLNKSFIYQLFVWLFIVMLSKSIVLLIIILPAARPLNSFGKWLLTPVSHNSNAELTIVMVVFPVLFNIIQFWVQDTFLKGKKHYIDPCLLTDIDNDFKKKDNNRNTLSSPLTEYTNL
tara:strand:- start:242 stop:976 length:735 start_codon:yes stop_codon:yes gene_type:complete